MVRYNRLLTELNLILTKPGIKAPQLARETGVCERTVYRDLKWLASQYPVIHNHGYSLAPSFHLKPLIITKAEYTVFQLAFSSPALQRLDLKMTTTSLKAKIDTVVDLNIRNCSIDFLLHAPVSANSCSDPQRIVALSGTLQQAIVNCRAIDIDLVDNIEMGSRVYPYYLVYYYPDWVLVGYFKKKMGFEALKLSFIREITLTNQNFERDARFSLQEFFQSRWRLKGGREATVRVRFICAAATEILSQKHHPREQVVKNSDGTVLYTVTVSGTEEIARWILGFGPEAEVLAPESLREQIREHSRCLARVYSKRTNGIESNEGTRLCK